VILLGDRPLTLAEVELVARGSTTITIGSESAARMKKARAVIEGAVREGRVIYGVTTGFGELKDRHIPPEQVRELQVNLLRSHRAGVGRPASLETVRAMLLLRAASLAHGYSGCRVELVDALLELLARDVTPVVPLQGSVGMGSEPAE
jgi:histidine ammonia-lyase